MKLRGSAAIVTGSSSSQGVGGEVAKSLAERGCNVAVNYASNAQGADEVVAECKEFGVDAVAIRCDVSRDDDCRAIVREVADRWGRLDILVNNAAVTRPIPLADLEAVEADEFFRVMAVNLVGAYQMARAATPHLRDAGDAAIVNVSSLGGSIGAGSSIPYATSKGALNSLTLLLARVLAPEVRVNAVLPGVMIGSWTRKMLDEEGYASRVAEARSNHLQQPLTPAHVASTIRWVIEEGRGMTGELLRIDSGQHLRQ